ncbi:phosphoglycolate phosphatase [Aureococcus anophagefferens]|nr:phosphoglycolate phosphatase [Aureococcus anophagefferens]
MPLFSKFVVALTVVGRAAAFGRIGARAGALRVRSGGDTRLHSAVATAGTPTKLGDPQEFLDSVDVFIFDCDGVIWKGDSLIDRVPAVLKKLRELGKRIFFVTNNSTKSRKGYKKKFEGLGLEVEPEEIFSSSFAAAAYLEQTKFKDTGKKVYIIGESASGELDLIGVPHIGAGADSAKAPDMKPGGMLEVDEDIGAVVVGFDREVNYYKIQTAQLAINELGAEFIATNLDAVTHLTDAQEWAGNGAMVGAIKGCGREPRRRQAVALMIDYMEEKFGLDRARICMVGDRLDLDILFGNDNGLKSCLTLSGVTTEALARERSSRLRVDSIADYLKRPAANVLENPGREPDALEVVDDAPRLPAAGSGR